MSAEVAAPVLVPISTTALALLEPTVNAQQAHAPLKISGSLHQEREDRAQALARMFIGEMIPLLVQVRQDFLDKDRDETICGVKTFTEYCRGTLRYSASHIRNLIAGQNPATSKHDGSANRKPKVEPHPNGGGQKASRELQIWRKSKYPEVIAVVQSSVRNVAARAKVGSVAVDAEFASITPEEFKFLVEALHDFRNKKAENAA